MFSFFRKTTVIAALALSIIGISLTSTVRAANSYDDINGSTGNTTAQGIIFANICDNPVAADGTDTCDCRKNGNCTLDDALQVFVNISTFILGITGTCVLFVFIYGGWKWLLSRGDPKWVESGKAAMTAGVIGLCIIFGAYVAINFIVSGLTTKAGETPSSSNLETTINQGITTGAPDPVFSTE